MPSRLGSTWVAAVAAAGALLLPFVALWSTDDVFNNATRVRTTRDALDRNRSLPDAPYTYDRARAISGSVRSTGGGPLAGARIRALPTESWLRTLARDAAKGWEGLCASDCGDPLVSATAWTDADGGFRFDRPAIGHYTLLIDAPDRMRTRVDHVLVADGWGAEPPTTTLRPAERREVELPAYCSEGRYWPFYSGVWPVDPGHELDGSGRASIERRSPDGWPESLVVQHDQGWSWFALQPDAHGEAPNRAYPMPPPGSIAPLGGWADLMQDASVLPALAALSQEIEIRSIGKGDCALSIRPYFPNSVVHVRLPSGAWISRFSNGNGEVELVACEPGPYVAQAILPTGMPSVFEGVLLRPGDQRELFLSRAPRRCDSDTTHTVLGFVERHETEACAGANVICVVADGGRAEFSKAVTDERGFFAIPGIKPSESYELRYSQGQWGDASWCKVVPNPQDPGPTLAVLTFTGAELHVPVPTGAENASFTLLPECETGDAVPNRAKGGSVRFGDVPPGEYRVVCSPEQRGPDLLSSVFRVDTELVLVPQLTWSHASGRGAR